MATIVVIYRQDVRNGPVLCYARCWADNLRERGHNVIEMGEGHAIADWEAAAPILKLTQVDLILEIENGRGADGKLIWKGATIETTIPKAVVFIDDHGHPDNHQSASRFYDHVFFAVWARRDLYKDHPSAHWCPNVTDYRYFGWKNFKHIVPSFDVGFFSSKMGLPRANDLIDRCRKNGWTYDVREAVRPRRNRWPATGEAMAGARILFNHGQKRDGPNQRVMESMALKRPLLSDRDPDSGMPKLFQEGKHYLAYDKREPEELEEKLRFLIEHPREAQEIADAGYKEVVDNHLVGNRVTQVLEVCGL